MKLRPILTIVAVLGVAALLFLPADTRAASLLGPDDGNPCPAGRWINIDISVEYLLPAKPK